MDVNMSKVGSHASKPSNYNDTYRLKGEHIYNGVHMPGFCPPDLLNEIKNHEFDDDDVIIATYCKCGTSLMQAITYLVLTEDFDHEKPLQQLVPFLDAYDKESGSGLDRVKNQEIPGALKTHLLPNMFEKTLKKKKTKFIVIIRNVKDVLVSYYHMYTMCYILGIYKGTWDDFFEMFKEDRLAWGSYFKHVAAWWELKDYPRVLLVKYEDILKDPEQNIRKVATHLGKDLSDESVKKIAEQTLFKSMRADPRYNREDEIFTYDISTSPFMRRGKVGDWKNYFTKEQSDYCDELVKKYFKPIGLEFEYE